MGSMRRSTAEKVVQRALSDAHFFLLHHSLRYCSTAEQISEYIADRSYRMPEWEQLPAVCKSQISTTHNVYSNIHFRRLVYTHVIDGRRVECHDPVCNGRAKEIYEDNQVQDTSDDAYVVVIERDNNKKLVFVPYHTKQRQQDIDAGILLQSDLDVIFNPAKHQATVTFRVNGGHADIVPVEKWPTYKIGRLEDGS